MNKQLVKISTVRTALGWVFGISAIILCILAAIKYWGEFTSLTTELSVWMLVVGLGLYFVSCMVRTAGSFVLMASIESPIHFLTALRAWSYSQIVGYIPGKVPSFLVRLQVCREDNASPSKVFATTVLEIIFNLISALSIWLLSLVWKPLPGNFPAIGYLILLLFLIAALHPKVIMMIMKIYYKWRGASYEKEVPRMDIASILKPGILYFLGWLLYGFGGYFILRAVVPASTGPLPAPFYIAGIFPFAWAAGYLFFLSPGGLGAREGVIILAIAPWTSMGIAVGVSLLARLCNTGIVLGFAAIWWLVHLVKSNKVTNSGIQEFRD